MKHEHIIIRYQPDISDVVLHEFSRQLPFEEVRWVEELGIEHIGSDPRPFRADIAVFFSKYSSYLIEGTLSIAVVTDLFAAITSLYKQLAAQSKPGDVKTPSPTFEMDLTYIGYTAKFRIQDPLRDKEMQNCLSGFKTIVQSQQFVEDLKNPDYYPHAHKPDYVEFYYDTGAELWLPTDFAKIRQYLKEQELRKSEH